MQMLSYQEVDLCVVDEHGSLFITNRYFVEKLEKKILVYHMTSRLGVI